MAEWYIITRDKRYLTQAEAVWNYLAQYGGMKLVVAEYIGEN